MPEGDSGERIGAAAGRSSPFSKCALSALPAALLLAAALSVAGTTDSRARPDGATSLAGLPLYRSIARHEAARQGVPFELVDAVMWVESNYDPFATGGVGEIGLMQIRPSTARMLGYRGTLRRLRWPQTNIRLGTRYLAQAWRLGKQDICTAVMKYRAGHGEHRFSARSVAYCKKVRRHLARGGYKVTGKLPKVDFGFYAGTRAVRRGAWRTPRTAACYIRVIQPGPRFGKCIPLKVLQKRGLFRNVRKARGGNATLTN